MPGEPFKGDRGTVPINQTLSRTPDPGGRAHVPDVPSVLFIMAARFFRAFSFASQCGSDYG